jgi:hypothetical protein
VVNLTPVKSISGFQLAEITKQVVFLLEQAGFKVLCVISDNNRINQNMFSILHQSAKDDATLCFPTLEHPVFYMFDTVHIIKCVRNNWINAKDTEETLITPIFGNYFETIDTNKENVAKVKFTDLRTIYKNESSFLLKKAFRLNHKTVYPSSFTKGDFSVKCFS